MQPLRTALIRLLLAALLAAGTGLGARAQDEGGQASFITPFPENDTYKVQIVGDWWAEGMIEGLAEAFAPDNRMQVTRRRQAINSLFRNEHEEDIRALDELVGREKPHIVIVMGGMADRVSARLASGKRAPVGSEEWRTEYARRIDRVLRALKKPNVAVYWVSQPKLRRADADEDAQTMNEIVRERVYLNGMKYIDVHGAFADEAGNFNAYGPDLTGKSRLLRDAEGVGFTGTGYRMLAHFVERDVKRDVAQARAERSIPLAGSEAEQARIHPPKAEPAKAGEAPAGDAGKGTAAANVATAARGDPSLEQKADHGRISLRVLGTDGREQTVAMEILRPAIPASVVALVARRQVADKALQPGDVVHEDIPGGLTVLSTITPANDSGSRRRQSPTQTAYFRVLVKGERLQPKPGRADDFSWPRQEPPLPAEAAAPADADKAGKGPAPRARPSRPPVKD